MSAVVLYFVVFKEDDLWVALGLQKRVVAQSPTLAGLKENIALTLRAFREAGDDSFDRLPMAGAKYWEMFVSALESGHFLGDPISEEEAQTYAMKLAA